MRSFITVLLSSLVLSACGGAGIVKSPFPVPPAKLMDVPVEMKTIKPMPSETKVTDTAPSGVKLSEISKIITANYQTCNEYKEQIFGLQGWITQQRNINK